MPSRDSQTVILSRQTILLVTAVGVGLLTLCYVLGVQVGKQSAAMGRPEARGAGEDLQELPAPMEDQLKALEAGNGEDAGLQPPAPAKPAAPAAPPAAAKGAPADPKAAPAAKVPPPVEVRMTSRPQPQVPADRKAQEAGRWTLQLVSTPDQAEAQRMVARAKAAGFPAAVLAEKGLFKVRLTTSGPRESTDATALKLKNRGFKPFAMKVE